MNIVHPFATLGRNLFLTRRCGGGRRFCGGCGGRTRGSTEFRRGACCCKIPHLPCLSRTRTLSGEKLKPTQDISCNFFYYSGGEPRLVDSVCIWATCAWGNRVPWQSPRGGVGPCSDCGRGRSLGVLGRRCLRQRNSTSWMPRH